MWMLLGTVEGGGDVDDDDGDNISNMDGTTSCFDPDSNDSDGGEAGDGPLCFVVKRSNALTVIRTRRLYFLNITNFIASGFSFECYLKAYGCGLTKGYFPYEWIDSLEKPRCTSLLPQEAFYSQLKGTCVTDEVVMHGCQGSAVPTSASTTHAYLVCSRLSLKVLAWWHSIQIPITDRVLLLRRPVARGPASRLTSLQKRFTSLCWRTNCQWRVPTGFFCRRITSCLPTRIY